MRTLDGRGSLAGAETWRRRIEATHGHRHPWAHATAVIGFLHGTASVAGRELRAAAARAFEDEGYAQESGALGGAVSVTGGFPRPGAHSVDVADGWLADAPLTPRHESLAAAAAAALRGEPEDARVWMASFFQRRGTRARRRLDSGSIEGRVFLPNGVRNGRESRPSLRRKK